MRIVQFANFYTPTSGGLRTCVEEIGRRYIEQGHERVLAVPGREDDDELTPAGRRVTFASPPLLGTGEYRVLVARKRLLRLLDAVQPDILEVSDKLSVPWLSGWARRHEIPIVLFSHERLHAVLGNLPGRVAMAALADRINYKLSTMVDAIVVASEYSAEEFIRVGATHVQRIPLGVDLSTFQPLDKPRADDRVVRLVLLSRLSSEKNPILALETVDRLLARGIRAELTIVGDGPLRRTVHKRALGLPVRFMGHVADRDRVARLVAEADVSIAPARRETFGLATLEALACGTPVVVPTEGALAELVDGPASGVVCRPTPEDFADGVCRLVALPRSVRQHAARDAAQRYPWSRTVTGLLGLYREGLRPHTNALAV